MQHQPCPLCNPNRVFRNWSGCPLCQGDPVPPELRTAFALILDKYNHYLVERLEPGLAHHIAKQLRKDILDK